MSHDSIRGYVRPSVGPSVGPSVMLLSAGRDEPANDLFRVYELVTIMISKGQKNFMCKDKIFKGFIPVGFIPVGFLKTPTQLGS